MGDKIDEMHKEGKIDDELALEILSTCIKGETNFWRSACDEPLLNVINECVVLFNDKHSWKFETDKENKAKQCYDNPKEYTKIENVDNLSKILVINKKLIESNKPNTESELFLVGKAVIESYLNIEDSVTYQTDLEAKNIVSYVLYHVSDKGTQMIKSKRQMDINNAYKDIGLYVAKLIITVKEDLTLEITSQSGWGNYISICIGAWFLGKIK